LHFASDDVYTIYHCTEKIIRQHTDVLMSKNIYFIIVSKTLQIIPHSVFHHEVHNLEQEPLYDHRRQLIYLVVQNYLNKRLKHESDKLCDVKHRIRMFNNKMTIFKGE